MRYYDLDKTKTFLVSQKALIIEEGQVLLLKDTYRDKWELPGGLLELDEDLAVGLQREIYEEIGFEIAIGKPISICDAWVSGFLFQDGRLLDARVIVITYLCTKIGGNIQLSDEHTDFIWVDSSNWRKLDLAPDCSLALNTFFAAKLT